MTNGTASTTETILAPCGRCGGTGRIPEFGHVGRGICFRCDGFGKIETTKAKADQAAREMAQWKAGAEARSAKAKAEWTAIHDGNWATFTQTHPDHAKALTRAADAGISRAAELVTSIRNGQEVDADWPGRETPTILELIESLKADAFSDGQVDLAVFIRDLFR